MRSALNKELRPNMNIMRAIGVELREGFRGGNRATGIRVNSNGTVTHGSAKYPYGIMRGKSPDGSPYEPLNERTIEIKRKEGSRYATQPLRFRPIGDDMALVNATRIRIYSNRDGVELKFVDGEMNRRSNFHEEGGIIISPTFVKKGGGGIKVTVPARPHRGIQSQVEETIARILKAWNERSR